MGRGRLFSFLFGWRANGQTRLLIKPHCAHIDVSMGFTCAKKHPEEASYDIQSPDVTTCSSSDEQPSLMC